ncbi:probable aquaporin NIP7-1 isoform X2 [Momordica charantia]|uniref:Probable aquaporin NIP7-1 isoform X2 n=1 Tax=Momordica charantia TaxID=3673 RepID=A0A6J1C8T1_MOMCH|nr:probable aquaporin NIP7-1 isoform X2 [Momordica charantia]
MDPNPARPVLAEMVGSFLLMVCVCGTTASAGLMGLFDYAVAAGLTVGVLTFSFRPISGAHFNPAITLASAIFSHFPWSLVMPYAVAQTTGCVMATYAGMFIYNIKPQQLTTRPFQPTISAFLVELLAAFILMFLVSSLAHHQHQSVGQFSGFVIGMAIGLAVLITGPISGGSMNPARSLGPAIVSWAFDDIWIYITAPVIGAVSGAFLYGVLRLRPPRANSPSSASTTRLFPRSSSANACLIIT